jgi:oligopeptidase A
LAASSTDLTARLHELARQFASNLASSTRDFAWHVTSAAELAGLPDDDLERAKRTAESAGVDGFLLTLDAHSFFPALASLEDRGLRKNLYEAFYTRASDRGPRAGNFDNTPLLTEMLELRFQLARQAGFSNFAALAVQDGVVSDPDGAESTLLALHRTTRAKAQAELDTLWAFAKEKGVPRGFSNWDLPFYLALWQRERLGFDARAMRDYFELEASVRGAFDLAAKLLGVGISPAPGLPQSYVLRAAGGAELGVVELEPFGSAAFLGEELVVPITDAAATPSVRIECGFEQPWFPEAAVRLDHLQLQTLFRCVGRALYLLVTASLDHPRGPSRQALLGSRVAGYLYERFASDFATLAAFARHRQTGQALSHELFDSLVQSRAAHTALSAASELELELFDIRVHRDHIPAAKSTQLRVQVLDTFTQVRREQSVLPPSYWTRFANISTPLFVHDEASRLWERSWARNRATALFEHLKHGSGQAALRETFWAAGEAGVMERVACALGEALPTRAAV